MKSMHKTIQILLLLFTISFTTASETSYEDIRDENPLEIKTPSLKNRKIAKIRLKNGLNAYLISDPDTDKSSAALSVGVGSWSDPKEFPGTAHFLEHMLFMGSKAYPDENEYFRYISDHGGSANAYTWTDRTVYMFSVNNNAFAGTLDRFSHFFIDPLFKASSIDRELHAIDQEHGKNIENDGRREWEIFKALNNPNHKNNQFATGNTETLKPMPRETLVKWYDEHYSSNIMNLVIYSSLSIDELKKLVVEDFSAVKTSPLASRVEYGEITSSKQKGHVTYIKPVRDVKELSMFWEFPEGLSRDMDTNSDGVVCKLFQNNDKNGLEYLLKEKNLISDMSCSSFGISSVNKGISISYSLTTEGVKNVDLVIEDTFKMINKIRASQIPYYLFEEMQTMAKINYEHQSKCTDMMRVSSTASELLDEPLETYPYKTTMAQKYSSKNIQDILSLMTPENCVFNVSADPKLTGVATTEKEKYTGAEYTTKKLSDHYLAKLSHIEPSSAMGLQSANPFIPKDLSVHQTPAKPAHVSVPEKIQSDEYGVSYFWQDDTYKVPQVDFKFLIKTPLINGTAMSAAYSDLFITAFDQELTTTLRKGATAGLYASLSRQGFDLIFDVYGFSGKATSFATHILERVQQLDISKEKFDQYLELVKTNYKNANKAQPYIQTGQIAASILFNDAPLPSEKLKALESITYENFYSFTQNLLNTCYVESLLAGNLTKEEAKHSLSSLLGSLNYKAFGNQKEFRKKVLLLPEKQGPYMVIKPIDALGNAALLVIEQGKETPKRFALQKILSSCLQETFFNTLRTKQQTGYITSSFPRYAEDMMMQFFIVQSNSHQPQDLLARYELFLEGYIKDFSEQLSDERFEKIKASLINKYSQPQANLQDKASFLFDLAFEEKGNFFYRQDLLKALETTTYKEVDDFTLDVLSRKNGRRLAILAEGRMDKDQLFKYNQVTAEALIHAGKYISSDL